jgi:hypothetical protein
MSYKLRIPEKDVFGKAKYVSPQGKTGCAEFVRQATGAPQTTIWKKERRFQRPSSERSLAVRQ